MKKLLAIILVIIIMPNLTVKAHSDIELLAEVMYYENYYNGREAMLLTGTVVLNRVASKRYPNTVKDVLYQKNPVQYSTTGKFFKKKLPIECYACAVFVYVYRLFVPRNVVYQAMFMQGSGLYKDINGDYFCYE